jgi:hypothetical protein
VTIRGSRRPAATIAGAGAFWVIVLGISAVVLRQPSLLLLVAFLAVIFPLPVVWLLRPISLTFDGADLIYRFGGRETRRLVEARPPLVRDYLDPASSDVVAVRAVDQFMRFGVTQPEVAHVPQSEVVV